MDAQYHKVLTIDNLLAHFPWDKYKQIHPNQQAALEQIAANGSTTIEMPTGSGKTAVGYTLLRTLADAGMGPLFYITPNKTLVNEVFVMHPDLTPAYGRNEYDCLYYSPDIYKADDVPCLSLKDCLHRVDQQVGTTFGEDAQRCPYYWAKYKAKQSQIVVCTTAFYLYTNLFSREFDPAAGLVIDEAHEMADVLRRSLSYEITDYHLKQSIKVLQKVGADKEAKQLGYFLKTMVDILNHKPWVTPTLLQENELLELIDALKQVDAAGLRRQLGNAIAEGLVDPKEDRVMLKRLEEITLSLGRYIRSFEYSLPGEGRNALNYVTYAEGTKSKNPQGKSELKLVVKGYYVVPITRRLMSPLTLAYSATIGDPDIFGIETGIQLPFSSLAGTFPAKNALVAMPKDTPDLAAARRPKAEPAKVLRRIALSCKWYAERDIRTLVVVVSNSERDRFLKLAEDEGVEAISYLNGSTPREALDRFKTGEGMVLVGTVANYGQGIDLPGGMAPVAFFLRPGYPSPKDPQSQFEEMRFGRQVWAVRNWRVMIQALQVRGRNIRSANDRGATIFVSQHFRKFLFGCLPEYLKPAYKGDLTLKEATEMAYQLVK